MILGEKQVFIPFSKQWRHQITQVSARTLRGLAESTHTCVYGKELISLGLLMAMIPRLPPLERGVLRILPLAICLAPQFFLCSWRENWFADYSGTAQSRNYADTPNPDGSCSVPIAYFLGFRLLVLRPPAAPWIWFTRDSTLWRLPDLQLEPEL